MTAYVVLIILFAVVFWLLPVWARWSLAAIGGAFLLPHGPEMTIPYFVIALLGVGCWFVGWLIINHIPSRLQLCPALFICGAVLILPTIAQHVPERVSGWIKPEPTITPSFSDVRLRIADDKRLMLSGQTNLPDGTRLCSSIVQTIPERKVLYLDTAMDPAKWDVIVTDGRFQSWFPSAYEKGLVAGIYILQIGVLPRQNSVLGPNNAWLSGPGVAVAANGNKTFTTEVEVDLPALPAHGEF
ncbi:MAG: hypothetical protein KUA35_10295 [Pseudodesulfovibrio sp.]|uniref:Uncharacterized protein n=1 Tax=Pseudodesulfovibrio aespoeensis (strain ATCC 700646 / DSM 10631 / Aspo-2) TaxID=643562 RepID=E6VUB4_PSEA9|nr:MULTISPECIES: hypothetical protein [Pseudodesulfovibrio]MBU4191354.1 hypothetical protein [Pseudomonadota bacterium]ADU63421.1 hypothetical protein Daes_2416 [Pseudodesulfovibrio aespoeensis Aspo-2]MBU4243468.1 hypothetical protein [Pseudomonadota bacterium]MBU4380031.1 hypothetical protein [Pseudomonadota bacterium]MBU4473802.1 hypothetical protein [Pseudomonadota bacterium]